MDRRAGPGLFFPMGDRRYTLHLGDAVEQMQQMPEASVQTIVTSPPYWGLRDYGVAGQIGLEDGPLEFVAKIVDVFREAWRVLRDDGTLWLNLGDSYAGSWGAQGRSGLLAARSVISARQIQEHPKFGTKTGSRGVGSGIKPKDLIGVPWRVALALQDAGWYLRSDIIWHKPNAMPESVTDRPTKSHEYLFLLSKREQYYYDADAIREPLRPKTLTTFGTVRKPRGNDGLGMVKADNWSRTVGLRKPKTDESGKIVGANRRTVWTVSTEPFLGNHFATFPTKLIEPCILAGAPAGGVVFDPFTGSGTTGVVALRHGRGFVGVELNPEYYAMAEARLAEAERQQLLPL